MMKQLVWVTTVGVFGIAGSVQATEPAQLTEKQMDRVVAGEFTVDTQGQKLELIAPGNNINSSNSGQCYWYNTAAEKEIGKPVQGF
jgi:surface antigen